MSQAPHRTRATRRKVGAMGGSVLVLLVLSTAMAPAASANWLTDLLGLTAPSSPSGGSTTTTTPNLLCWMLGLGCSSTPTTKVSTTTSTTRATTTTASTMPTTTTTAFDPGDPTKECGGFTTLPRAGGGTWRCSFDDEFVGTTLDRTKWSPQTTAYTGFSSGGQDCFMDTPDNVHVASGNLVLTTRKEDTAFRCAVNDFTAFETQVTSGMVSTSDRFSQTYGRFEARMRVTGAKQRGLQEAFWLWPVDATTPGPFPWAGEIDVAEIYHSNPDRAIPYIHYSNSSDTNVTNNFCMIDDISKFHTYVVEWTSVSIKIIYDGVTCLEDKWEPVWPQSGRQPFDAPFLVALTQGLGQGANSYQSTTPLPASTEVDYVRVYK
jgi:beta-glucanase (GH16 family)